MTGVGQEDSCISFSRDIWKDEKLEIGSTEIEEAKSCRRARGNTIINNKSVWRESDSHQYVRSIVLKIRIDELIICDVMGRL